jgi:hypothetical protein
MPNESEKDDEVVDETDYSCSLSGVGEHSMASDANGAHSHE